MYEKRFYYFKMLRQRRYPFGVTDDLPKSAKRNQWFRTNIQNCREKATTIDVYTSAGAERVRRRSATISSDYQFVITAAGSARQRAGVIYRPSECCVPANYIDTVTFGNGRSDGGVAERSACGGLMYRRELFPSSNLVIPPRLDIAKYTFQV